MIIIIFLINLTYLAFSCSIDFCSYCNDDRCLQCQYPYSLINGYCVGQACLNPSCISCNPYDLTWCRQCSLSYQLKNGECRIATYIIVAPIIIICIGVLLCLLYCILRINRRRERRKALEQLYNQQKRVEGRLPIPTSSQILDNPDFIFKYQEQKNFCSICLQNNSNLITQCGHYFHADCFSSWMRRQKICPICNNKNIQFVIVILCMTCKKRYYHYETSMHFLLQVKSDTNQQCTYCILHAPRKVLESIQSQQMILAPVQNQQQQEQIQRQEQPLEIQNQINRNQNQHQQ